MASSLLCFVGLHSWRHETRATPGSMAQAVLFYLRFCRQCSAAHIHVRPFMGVAAWVPLEPWPVGMIASVASWEQQKFTLASVANCQKLAGNYFRNDPA